MTSAPVDPPMKVNRQPPEWYANLPKWLQLVLSLALLFGVCTLCSLAVQTSGLLDPSPTATPAPPTSTIVPTDIPTSVPTDTAVPAGPPTTTPRPSATPDAKAALQALLDWGNEFNKTAGQVFYQSAKVNDTRCIFVVSDVWYGLEQYMKERLLEQAAEQCELAARIYLDHGDMTTSLESVSGKEVAYKSPLRTKINE